MTDGQILATAVACWLGLNALVLLLWVRAVNRRERRRG